MDQGLMTQLAPYAYGFVAGSLATLAYSNRQSLALHTMDYAVNKYVDLKWALWGAPELDKEMDGVIERPRVLRTEPHMEYTYNGSTYILHPHKSVHNDHELPAVDELSIDAIADVVIHGIFSPETEDLITTYIKQLSGPHGDFHEMSPSIAMLHPFISKDLLEGIEKIIVNTEDLKEYVLI